MIVYRVCSKREISRIVSDKGFCGVGNYYDVNLKLNTFRYDDSVKYLHFYDRYEDILHSNVSNGRFICEYDIPKEMLIKYSGIGFYLDYINFRYLVDVKEYAIPTFELVFENLIGYNVIEEELDYDDMIGISGKMLVKDKILEEEIMKEERVINYYVLCNKLKDVIRTGWKDWKVNRERIESVAEHIFGVQMLAIAIKSEYQYDVDIMKVIFMLAIHELGETVIGDLTQFQISKEEKEIIEHKAVHNILGGLLDGNIIEELFLEFDEHKTKEAIFAYQCDKLECDLQCKLYDEEGCVDLLNQEDNATFNNPMVQELLKNGRTWSEMWLLFGQNKYPYDDNFMAISNYAMKNKIKIR